MATNQFLPFGQGAGANVLSQADWVSLAARSTGFVAGVASSAAANKAWRQSTLVAAAVGQIIADFSGQDANDTDAADQVAAKFLLGLRTPFNARLQVFTSSAVCTVPSGKTQALVLIWAAGAGGGGTFNAGSAASGGGGGEFRMGIVTGLTSGGTIPVTIGVKGSKGSSSVSPYNGTAGGNSSFGSYITCIGGQPGVGANGAVNSTGGAGGTSGFGGDLSTPGQAGGGGYAIGSSPVGGTGGGAFFTSITGPAVSAAGLSGCFPAGGGGGGSLGNTGGDGANGLALVLFI